MRWAALLIALALALVPLGALGVEAQVEKRNIVFVFTDDLDTYTMNKAMPKTRALIGDEGVTFKNAIFPHPVCCPLRSSMLRGQYTHNTNVISNEYPEGGFRRFHEQGLHRQTYATTLNNAGYRTFYAGKVMNGYGARVDGEPLAPVLPGFDVFRGAVASPLTGDYRFEDGSIRHFDRLNDDIATQWADTFIRNSGDQPFALTLSLHAPHLPADYPPAYSDLYTGEPLNKPPSFNEPDLSDKPGFMQFDAIDAEEREALAAYNRERLRSARFADNQIASLVTALQESGELNSTYFFVWSDNGYHMGQHRLPSHTQGSKNMPYLEDVELPLLVRGPGIPHNSVRPEIVNGVDLYPTFAQIAGAPIPSFVDGISLLPLAQGDSVPWRRYGYSEALGANHPWRAVYSAGFAYHEWAEGPKEFYDTVEDPYQLEGTLEPTEQTRATGAKTVLEEYRNCAGTTCRVAGF